MDLNNLNDRELLLHNLARTDVLEREMIAIKEICKDISKNGTSNCGIHSEKINGLAKFRNYSILLFLTMIADLVVRNFKTFIKI